jgi:hypothetical protein
MLQVIHGNIRGACAFRVRRGPSNAPQRIRWVRQARLRSPGTMPLASSMPVWINLCACPGASIAINNATVIHGKICGACASVSTQGPSNALQCLLGVLAGKVEALQDAPLRAACLCGSILRMPWSNWP